MASQNDTTGAPNEMPVSSAIYPDYQLDVGAYYFVFLSFDTTIQQSY